MRLRGRARERAEALAAQAAAQAQLRAEIQTLFEAQARAQTTTLETLRDLRDDVVSHDAEVVRVLELAVNVCDHVIECVEADRVERQAIVEALGALATAINGALHLAPAPNTGPHLIGGRVRAGDDTDAIVHEPAPMIELNEAHDRSVEVKCRYEGRWVDGFEVCETIHTDAGERYRLRRRIDGTILPELFAAGDIRHVETFEELEPAVEVPAPRRIWSKL